MQNNGSKSSWVAIVGVIIVAVIAYYIIGGSESLRDTGLLQVTDNTSSTGAVGGRILQLLNEVKTLKIDDKIFQDPVYASLTDHTVEIPSVNVGRINPFAPIPGFNPNPPTNPAR